MQLELRLICAYEFQANRSAYPDRLPYNYCSTCPYENPKECDKFRELRPQGEPIRRGRNVMILHRIQMRCD